MKKKIVENEKAKPPRVHELGGGYYYTCFWFSCNETLKRYWRYCPNCGTKILWGKDEE